MCEKESLHYRYHRSEMNNVTKCEYKMILISSFFFIYQQQFFRVFHKFFFSEFFFYVSFYLKCGKKKFPSVYFSMAIYITIVLLVFYFQSCRYSSQLSFCSVEFGFGGILEFSGKIRNLVIENYEFRNYNFSGNILKNLRLFFVSLIRILS